MTQGVAGLAAMPPARLARYCDTVRATRPVPLLLLAAVMCDLAPGELTRLRHVAVDLEDFGADELAPIRRLMVDDTAESMLREQRSRWRPYR